MIYLLLQNQLIINKIFSSHDLFTFTESIDKQHQLIINKIFSSHDLFTFTESSDNQQNILLS